MEGDDAQVIVGVCKSDKRIDKFTAWHAKTWIS
jgi:hypothetical protein